MHRISTRTVVSLVLVGALVLTAGCTGIGLGDGDADATETVESTATETPGESGEDTGSDGDEEGDADTSDEEDAHDHGDHEHDAEEEESGDDADADSNETDDTTGTGSTVSSGRMTVGVDESKLDLPARDQRGDEFSISQSDGHTWLANESGLTLAEALSHVDVEASSSEASVDGEQYRDGDDGTTVSYRVNGEPVDPEEYALRDGDRVWVTVATEATNFSSPGTYIKAAEQHAHGEMTFVVDGAEVDFSQEKYQSNHRYFHYEHGDGEKWHAHSVSLSLEYALSSLADIDADGDAIEYNGTYYDPEDEGTSVDVTANGEPVDPGTYVLKDGDSVRIVIESEE